MKDNEAAVVLNRYYCPNDGRKYGLDHTNFQISLSKKFEYMDIITCWEGKERIPSLWITEDEILRKEMFDGTVYFVHTVCITDIVPSQFYPDKYLIPGTRYSKIPLYDDLHTPEGKPVQIITMDEKTKAFLENFIMQLDEARKWGMNLLGIPESKQGTNEKR
jgi:hypothetical protein